MLNVTPKRKVEPVDAPEFVSGGDAGGRKSGEGGRYWMAGTQASAAVRPDAPPGGVGLCAACLVDRES